MRLLVCGGRDYADERHVFVVLDAVHTETPITAVIEGGARGADTLARRWAEAAGIPVEEYPADWRTFGRSAGHVRNARMLREGRPDRVVAFPGGRGTTNMVALTRQAGIPVVEVRAPAIPL